jgi:hypothetical protein
MKKKTTKYKRIINVEVLFFWFIVIFLLHNAEDISLFYDEAKLTLNKFKATAHRIEKLRHRNQIFECIDEFKVTDKYKAILDNEKDKLNAALYYDIDKVIALGKAACHGQGDSEIAFNKVENIYRPISFESTHSSLGSFEGKNKTLCDQVIALKNSYCPTMTWSHNFEYKNVTKPYYKRKRPFKEYFPPISSQRDQMRY